MERAKAVAWAVTTSGAGRTPAAARVALPGGVSTGCAAPRDSIGRRYVPWPLWMVYLGDTVVNSASTSDASPLAFSRQIPGGRGRTSHSGEGGCCLFLRLGWSEMPVRQHGQLLASHPEIGLQRDDGARGRALGQTDRPLLFAPFQSSRSYVASVTASSSVSCQKRAVARWTAS